MMKSVKKKAVETPYSGSLYVASGALARQIDKLAKEAWKPSGLHPSHGYLLLIILLYGEGEISYPTFLSKDLMVSPSTITRFLDKLEKKGLITRWPYEHLMVIGATNKAKQLLPILEECKNNFTRECARLLGRRDTYMLATILNKATDLLAQRTTRTV